jgi:uncharacterized protein (DUF302 family)
MPTDATDATGAGVPDTAVAPGAASEAPEADAGIITKASPYSVDETVARIEAVVRAQGLTRFALIDHSGEAARVGLTMQPAKLLIFGSPTAGTPLMVAAPLLALDLPLKALIWQDAAGLVLVSYNSTAYLARRHHLANAPLHSIAGIDPLLANALAQ